MAEPESQSQTPLVQFLTDRGYTEAEIQKILNHMAVYDQRTQSDALFDSIGGGSLSIDDIIREALGE
jgi:hypothetical protein